MTPPLPHDEREQIPQDGYGPGYLAYSIRTEFRDMCRIVGFQQARQIVAEIIADEAQGKRR